MLVATTGGNNPQSLVNATVPGHRPGRARGGRAGRRRLRLHPGRGPSPPRPAGAAVDRAAGRRRAARPCSATTGGGRPRPRRSGGSTCPSTSSPSSRTPCGPGRTLPRRPPPPHRCAVVPVLRGGRAPIRYAWLRDARSADEIITVTDSNRMIAYPYTKLLTANMQVDQGAAIIMCSAAAARSAGIPRDRWVFPLAGADADDHWFLSHRLDFHSSPAIRLAGASALALAGAAVDDVAHIDLYSCFPSAVEIAAAELGLPATTRPAADRDRRAHLRRRPGQQLRHPRGGVDDRRPPRRPRVRWAW